MNLLGLFAKAPSPGSVKTRLAESIGPTAACALYQAFLQDLAERCRVWGDVRQVGYAPATEAGRAALAAIFDTGYEFWPQPTGDLGARMEAFFLAAFAAGAERTVLIGTDSPDLPAESITAAWAQLSVVDVVFGPALDGGYYLIGARRFLPGALANVRWSTDQTLAESIRSVEAAGLTTALLPLWGDVDTAEDLIALRDRYEFQRRLTPDAPCSATEEWLHAHSWLPSCSA